MLVLKIISGVVLAYILVLVIRILLSWFSAAGVHGSREYSFLYKITEPYLRIFRKIKFLHIKNIDFSPVIAILVLQLISFILMYIVAFGTITFGVIAYAVISGIWNIISFILILLLILFVVKIIVLLARANTASKFVITIDNILHPVMAWINIRLFKRKIVQYRTSMVICTSIFALLLVGGYFLLRFLRSVLI